MAQTVREPEFDLTITSAQIEKENQPQKMLLIGQFADAGASPTATPGELIENVQSAQIAGLVGGRGSLPHMLRAQKEIAPEVSIDAIPIGAGTTAAELTITAVGTATAAGSIELVVASKKDHRFPIDIPDAADETAAIVLLDAAVNADTACPFTSTKVAGVQTLVAEDKGTVAAKYPVRIEGSVPGLVFTIAISVVGAGDPAAVTDSATLDVIGDKRYQEIVWPWADFTVPKALVDARNNASGVVLDGDLWVGQVKSHADLLTAAGSENSERVEFLGSLLEDRALLQGASVPELPEVVNTMMATIGAKRVTDGANVSRYVVTAEPRDQFGGIHMNSLPNFNTRLPLLGLPLQQDGFTTLEQTQLRDAGIWIVGADPAGAGMIAGEVVTTYLTDGGGFVDPTFKYRNLVKTSSAVREFIITNMRAIFAQTRLTQGDLVGGHDMVNTLRFRNSILGLYATLGGPGFVLVQFGQTAQKFVKENLNIDIDLTTGTITFDMQLPIMTQFRVGVGVAQITFDIEP